MSYFELIAFIQTSLVKINSLIWILILKDSRVHWFPWHLGRLIPIITTNRNGPHVHIKHSAISASIWSIAQSFFYNYANLALRFNCNDQHTSSIKDVPWPFIFAPLCSGFFKEQTASNPASFHRGFRFGMQRNPLRVWTQQSKFTASRE